MGTCWTFIGFHRFVFVFMGVPIVAVTDFKGFKKFQNFLTIFGIAQASKIPYDSITSNSEAV